MFISDQKQFIYVHVSKTAGSSIRAVLRSYTIKKLSKLYSLPGYFNLPHDYRKFKFRTHANLSEVQKKLPKEKYLQYFKFAFVRNPWDRLVSSYYAYYGSVA